LEDQKANEIDCFCKVLELSKSAIFGDATYAINTSRQTLLRRPDQLPDEDEVSKVQQYTVSSLEKYYTSNNVYMFWTNHEFVGLRDLTVSRLTMFNARRGGEPARMSILEWVDASKNVWIDQARVAKMHSNKKKGIDDMKIVYQTGKGNNHLVPVLIPQDTIKAMEMLSNSDIRLAAGIKANNTYMLPCAQSSDGHVSGWHAVNRVCKDAGVLDPTRLTATSMRHRASTIYANLIVPESERAFFYKHMGHSAAVNAGTYQTPLAETEVTVIGKRFQDMDSGAYGIYCISFYQISR